jgi:hypothetical protein
VGVQNVVDLKDLTIQNSGGTCITTAGVNFAQCFSIQQNFYVDIPGNGNQPALWVQNIVVIGQAIAGNYWDFAEYNIFNITGSTLSLYSCRGVVVAGKCAIASVPVPLSLPGSFNLSSKVSGTKLYLYLNGATIKTLGLGPKGAYVYGLCQVSGFISCPMTPFNEPVPFYQPQLNIVGEINSYQVTFGSPTDITVSSYVRYSGNSWSSSAVEGSVPFGLGSGETAINLGWSSVSANVADISYVNSASTQGTAFVPG